MKILVLHEFYGCETGCCGHVVKVDGEEEERFEFGHPRSGSMEDKLDYARKLVTRLYGVEHVADIDFEKCEVIYD